MSRTQRSGAPRRRGPLALAGLALMALLLGLAANPAGAAITITDADPTTIVGTSGSVVVEGTATPNRMITAAFCLIPANPMDAGRDCDLTSGQSDTSDATTGEFIFEVPATATFESHSFVPEVGTTQEDVSCADHGPDACAVLIVEYGTMGFPTDTEIIPVTFDVD